MGSISLRYIQRRHLSPVLQGAKSFFRYRKDARVILVHSFHIVPGWSISALKEIHELSTCSCEVSYMGMVRNVFRQKS